MQTEIDETVVQEDNIEPEVDETVYNTDKTEPQEEEDVITIEGETPPSQEENKAPQWVKELRVKYRESQEEIRRLKAEKASQSQPSEIKLPPKPQLSDFDYDSEQFEKAYEEWQEKKAIFQTQENNKKRQQEEFEQSWKNTVENYQTAKKSLKVQDYEFSEGKVQEKLNEQQQAIILQGATNPAHLVYALGKSQKLDELASIKDPIKFAFAIADLQGKLRVERKAPSPERTIKGGAPSSAIDSKLEALRAEAERTGDMSKVIAYKKSLKDK